MFSSFLIGTISALTHSKAVLSAKNSDRRRHFSGSVEIFRDFTLFRQTRKTAPWVPVCRNYAVLQTDVIRGKFL